MTKTLKGIAGFMTAILAIVAFNLFYGPDARAAGGFKNEPFVKTFYFSGASGSGNGSGLSLANAKAIADGDIMAIEAGTVIEKVYLIVDTALTGTTVLSVGDDDDADGFVTNEDINLSAAGMYGHEYGYQSGAYLRKYVLGATQPTNLAPSAKYYSAAGKEIKLDNTTTNTGGAFRVVVEGYKLSY